MSDVSSRPKVALITGARGLMGTALSRELSEKQGLTVVLANSSDTDLRNFDATCRLLDSARPDVVYHLAARVTGIMGNLRAQGQAYLDNVMMNTNLVEAARRAGVRKVIAMGSAAIYSDVIKLPMAEEDVWSGPPHASESGYAHAKRGMLAQLEAYRDQYGMDFAYCISTNLFGPFDNFDERHGHVIPSLVSKFHRAAQEGQPVTVWGSGTAERDFLYVKDAARAMRLIGESFSGPINFASGKVISILNAAELLKEISGLKADLVWDRSKPDGQLKRSYDVTKLSGLGFSPAYSFEEALRETYGWYSANVSIARR